jgi:Helix-turn-helix
MVTASPEPDAEHIEFRPIVVVTQAFPARPSALPDVRDFIRQHLTVPKVTEEDLRTLGDRVADLLLDAAGATGTIQVSLRIFPTGTEADLLFAPDRPAPGTAPVPPRGDPAERDGPRLERGTRLTPYRPDPAGEPEAPDPVGNGAAPSFAAWLSARLRAEYMTMEAAARKLEVSPKTISRWVSGTTEPRLRDLYRIRAVFGEPPFH